MTITENGSGRRTEYSEYRCQTRGGKGSINYKVSEERGKVVGVRSVEDTDDVIIITNDGVIIRIPVGEINLQSRYAQGVRVMRVGEDSRIVTFASAPHEEEETDEEEREALDNENSAGRDAADAVLAHAEEISEEEKPEEE